MSNKNETLAQIQCPCREVQKNQLDDGAVPVCQIESFLANARRCSVQHVLLNEFLR